MNYFGLSQQPGFPATNGEVSAIAIDGNIAYIGGTFSEVGGFVRTNLAAIDLNTNKVLPFSPIATSSTINALVVVNHILYIGCSGNIVSGFNTQNYAAAFNTSSNGTITSWNPNPNSAVTSIADDPANSRLVLAGMFTSIGVTPVSSPHLAVVDYAVGNATAIFGTTLNNTVVTDVAVDPATNNIYVVGDFDIAGGVTRNYAASYTSAGALTTWNPNLSSEGMALAISGTSVYVAGYFSTVNGSVPRPKLAAFDKVNGNIVGVDFGIDDGNGFSLYIDPSTGALVLGGTFTTVQNNPMGGLAIFDPTTSTLVGSNLNFSASILSTAMANGTLITGGAFTSPSGPYLAAFTIDYAAPMTPQIEHILRKNQNTFLKWAKVFLSEDLTRTSVQGYNIYRSTNENMETFVLVATITSTDVTGGIDTMFSESIQGYYSYQVTAFNAQGESLPVTVKAVDSTVGQDFV